MKTQPKRASGAASLTSQPAARPTPEPTAGPLTAAIAGFDMRRSATVTRRMSDSAGWSRSRSVFSSGSSERPCAVIWPMFPPEQKMRPRPVSTRTLAASSSSMRSMASASSRFITKLTALLFSGSSIQRVTTPSSLCSSCRYS